MPPMQAIVDASRRQPRIAGPETSTQARREGRPATRDRTFRLRSNAVTHARPFALRERAYVSSLLRPSPIIVPSHPPRQHPESGRRSSDAKAGCDRPDGIDCIPPTAARVLDLLWVHPEPASRLFAFA